MTDADSRAELEHYHASYSQALDDLRRYRELCDELRRTRGGWHPPADAAPTREP